MKMAVTDIGPGVISVELLKVCDFFFFLSLILVRFIVVYVPYFKFRSHILSYSNL